MWIKLNDDFGAVVNFSNAICIDRPREVDGEPSFYSLEVYYKDIDCAQRINYTSREIANHDYEQLLRLLEVTSLAVCSIDKDDK